MNFAINWGFLHDLQGSQRYIKNSWTSLGAPRNQMDGRLQLVQTGSGCRDGRMCAGTTLACRKKACRKGYPIVGRLAHAASGQFKLQTEHSESFQTRFRLGGLAEAGPRLVQSGARLDSNWFKLLQTGSDKKTGSD